MEEEEAAEGGERASQYLAEAAKAKANAAEAAEDHLAFRVDWQVGS